MRVFFTLSKSTLLIFSLCFYFIANSQTDSKKLEAFRARILSDPKVKLLAFSKERQTPHLISLGVEGKSYSAAQAGVVLNNFLGVRSGLDFLKLSKQSKLQGDAEVIEYQQYYKGIKVDRAKFMAFTKNNTVKFYNGAYYNLPQTLDENPVLTKDQALQFAKNRVAAQTYATDEITELINKSDKPEIKIALQKELEEASPNGELVFVEDFNKKDVAEVKLAYKFNIYASKPLSRSWVYVDAKDGSILLVDAIIKHVDDNPPAPPVSTSTSTSVQTRYAGSRSIYVKQISGIDPQNGQTLTSSHPTTETYVPGAATFVLADDIRGNGVETYDLNGVGGLPISVAPAYTLAKSFTDVDNKWTQAEHKRAGSTTDGAAEAENDDIAWDAHWGAEMVYDYWKNKHGRLSFDGKNAKIKSFIHSGIGYDNAFWNGSVMTYGDGSGVAAGGFKPLTSLDVCGHEIGHGVCEFTSNLVYAKESGAMNEALSDIWAACVEYYAIKNVDGNLKSVYKPFYIGEQIAANAARPLRRMDSPKAEGNPDTYGGQYWTKQDGCSPTLANDQCGVHNNSGVLNKWFYLITVGSGAGSGPDAAFAGTDDGINDAVTTGANPHPANAYSVTGLGFAVSEKITYAMETMLTSTATYEEARQVSIAVAANLSGSPCSAMVETVTDAWYAVGVGGKFVKPCTITYGFLTSAGGAITEASSPSGCTSSKTFDIPVLLPANSTATVSLSGTATKGTDYIVSATSLSNTATSPAKKVITVTIKNDGSIEGDEYATITLTVTNTGTNPVNKTYKLTILDDDVVPVIGNTQKTLLSSTFTGTNGFTDPAGWNEILEIPEAPNGDPTASGKNQWGIFDNKLAITGKEGTTGATLPNNTYNDNSNSQTLIKSPLIDASGLSLVSIKFDYTVQGEVDPQGTEPENFPAFDYMAVAYSLDGINFTELNSGNFRQFASAQPVSGTLNAALPASLANKKFYIAFRWFNDTNAGGPYSVSIDNLTVSGTARKIENDLNHNGKETLAAGENVYFYSTQQGEVLGKVKNGSSNNYGCTNIFVEKTGNTPFNLYQGTDGLHKVTGKVMRIESTYIYSGLNYVTLFFTDAQLKALEDATGKSRSAFKLYRVDAPAYTSATSTNSKYFTTTYSSIPGVGASYSITFTGKLNGSYAVGTISSQTGARNATPITGVPENWKVGNIYPNPGTGNTSISIAAPAQQKLRIDIINHLGQLMESRTMNLSRGHSTINLQTGKLSSGNYLIFMKDEKGYIINSQKFIKE